MTNDALIVEAAAQARNMSEALEKLWTEPQPEEAMRLLNELELASRKANSAIIALRQRAAGVKPPKIGD
jgi:hypothetical protein